MDKIEAFYENDLVSLQTASTSKGNQQKWYDKRKDLYIKAQFYYQNKYWRDDLVEVIGSGIGEQLPLLDKKVTILHQDPCDVKLNGRLLHGVYSKNFCLSGYRFISFQRLLDMNCLVYPYTDSLAEKWDFVLDVLKRYCAIDYTDYLVVMSLIDFLIGNEDRHLNNFGLLTDDENYRLAPLFDFGLGLFEHDRRYEGVPFRECLQKMECKPFHRNNCQVIDFIKSRYSLKEYLPEVLTLEEYDFPSAKATSYILNRGQYLGIEIEGVK